MENKREMEETGEIVDLSKVKEEDKMEEPILEIKPKFQEVPEATPRLFFTNPEIQEGSVLKTEFVLRDALSRIDLPKKEKDCLFNLWRQTLTEFREKNELVAHQEFHVAKVVQLSSEMADNCLGQIKEREEVGEEELENAFCLLAAAILHDNGQLPKAEEEENAPQQSFYPQHVLRGARRAKQIMEAWLVSQGYESEKQKRILAKITILIGATDLGFDDPFDKEGPPIWQWLEKGRKPQTLTAEKLQNEPVLEEIVEEVEKAIGVLGSGRQKELLSWVKIITAADLGSYALTPDYPLESVAFWQEIQQIFEEKGELKALRQNFPQEDLIDFLLSRFLPQAEETYGETLETWLDPNGEWQRNWEQVKQRKEMLEEISKEGVDLDIGHLEGNISPVKLLQIAQEYKLTKNLKLREALKEQSAALAKRELGDPISIEQLSTKTIRALLEAAKPEQRSEVMTSVFQDALETVKSEKVKKAKVIFSPDAYRWFGDQPGTGELMPREKIVGAFWQAREKVESDNFEVQPIYGFRQKAWETQTEEQLQETFTSIADFYEQGKIVGVNIGGTDPELEKLKTYVDNLTAKGIPFSCHMGLDRPGVLAINFEQFLEWTQKWRERYGSGSECPTLIIDDQVEEIIPLIRDKVSAENQISVVVTEMVRFLAQAKEEIEKHPIWKLWQLKDEERKIKNILLGGGNYILKGEIGPILEIFAWRQARQQTAVSA